MSSPGEETVSAPGKAAVGAPDPAATERTVRMHLDRRLDWRFLMDDPRLGRVAYSGPDSGALAAALRRRAVSVTPLAAATEGSPDGDGSGPPVDLVVLRGPTRRAVAAAARALPEGGRLYCEVDRRAALSALLSSSGRARGGEGPAGDLLWRGAGALLREGGFTDVRAHLHHPSFEECSEIVPLEAPTLTLSLGRRLPWLPAGWTRLAARLGAGTLGRLAPRVSLLARKAPGGSARGRPRWAGSGTDDRAGVAVTPRFRASGHVILLFPDAAGRRPVRVVKVARRPERSESVSREAANLRALQGVRPGGFASVPRVESTGRVDGTPFLVETGLDGRPMDRTFVRRRPESSVDGVNSWLLELHRATARRNGGREEAYRRLVARPLERLARAFPPGSGGEDLVAATRRLVRPLIRIPWPIVFEHGDLSHPNLLWEPGRGPGVVDWERAEPAGLPATDLFFFLAYVAIARNRAADRDGYDRAFDEAFVRPPAFVEEAVDRYAGGLEIGPTVLRALFAACWPRQLARLLDGVAPDGDGGGPGGGGDDGQVGGEGSLDPGTATWLRQHRFFLFWRRAVEEADGLFTGSGGARGSGGGP